MIDSKTAMAALLALSFFSAQVIATPSECSAITSSSERLACFDSHYPRQLDNEQAQYSTSVETIENVESVEIKTVVDAREAAEQAASENWFAILPHKQNYILPATYNSSPDYTTDYGPTVGGLFSDTEIKFQISLKTPIMRDLWRGSTVSVGYTQQSYWQLYADDEISAPFRETNHQPEVMWEIPLNFELLGFQAQQVALAFNHQSNGRSKPLSRSWNRITGEIVFAKERFALVAKTWKRIEESENDDNPNIEDYMGRVLLGAAYKGERHTFALSVKSSLGSKVRNGVELDWTFPLTGHLRGFVQLYSGYGENLIDMENHNKRIGLGIVLTDWL